jgi:hypothetical protein
MEFVLNTIKQPVDRRGSNNTIENNIDDFTDSFNDDKERILGAALAILCAYPEKCKDNKGQIKANRIVKIINEKGVFWFGDRIPNLSNSVITDLINRWLQTVC